MRFLDAITLIENKGRGYRVTFERRQGGSWHGDSFPERDEMPIESEEKAWHLAQRFAVACPEAVNIYVTWADTFVPVDGYETKTLRRYPNG